MMLAHSNTSLVIVRSSVILNLKGNGFYRVNVIRNFWFINLSPPGGGGLDARVTGY
jgi:hypothetical protein